MSKKLGTLIKEARTEQGWTQAELAKKIKGVEAADIGRYERAEAGPTQAVIKEIAKALGVTQKSLLEAAGGSGKKTTAKTSTAKTSSAKTSSAKTSTAKTSNKKTSEKKTTTGTSVKLTTTEKRLVDLYRKADTDTKKAAMSLLKGKEEGGGLMNILESVLKETGTSKSDLMGTLMQSFLGGSDKE